MTSNVIPIVSSSPPPFDDSQSFHQEECEGNDWDSFASFPAAVPADVSGAVHDEESMLADSVGASGNLEPVSHFKPVSVPPLHEEDDPPPWPSNYKSPAFDSFNPFGITKKAVGVEDDLEEADGWGRFSEFQDGIVSSGNGNEDSENRRICVPDSLGAFQDRSQVANDISATSDSSTCHLNRTHECDEHERAGSLSSQKDSMSLSGDGSIDPDRGGSCPKQDTISLESPVSEDSASNLHLSNQCMTAKFDGPEVTSQGSVTDSGLSSDISPGLKPEDEYTDFTDDKLNGVNVDFVDTQNLSVTPQKVDSDPESLDLKQFSFTGDDGSPEDLDEGFKQFHSKKPLDSYSSPELSSSDEDIKPNCVTAEQSSKSISDEAETPTAVQADITESFPQDSQSSSVQNQNNDQGLTENNLTFQADDCDSQSDGTKSLGDHVTYDSLEEDGQATHNQEIPTVHKLDNTDDPQQECLQDVSSDFADFVDVGSHIDDSTPSQDIEVSSNTFELENNHSKLSGDSPPNLDLPEPPSDYNNHLDDNEDEDDFATFEQFRINGPSEVGADSCKKVDERVTLSGSVITEEADVQDEFATFQEGSNDNEWAAFSGPTVVTGDTDDNWASFQATPTEEIIATELHLDSTQEDEFGAFADDTTSSVISKDPPSCSVSVTDLKVLSRLVECYPTSTNATENQTRPLTESLVQEVKRKPEPEVKPPSAGPVHRQKDNKIVMIDVCVWNNLRVVEKAAALKYQWAESSNSRCLLKAIAIDPSNILMGHKKTSVPIFAQLGVALEPTRGGQEASSPTQPPSVSLSPQILLEPNKPAATPICTQNVPPTQAVGTTAGVLPTQDIPPAEFDWKGSGLTNPLDASSSVQLDLDFFVEKQSLYSGVHASSSEALKKEQEFLQTLEPSESVPPKTLQPLETILANMNVKPTAPASAASDRQDEEPHSAEANKVLARLRSLTFMRSSVLLFPFKGNSSAEVVE